MRNGQPVHNEVLASSDDDGLTSVEMSCSETETDSVVKVFQTFLLLALKLWFHGCSRGATVDVKIQFPTETVPEHLRIHSA